MKKLKINPYELGISDYNEHGESKNPYEEFTPKWSLYNKGFNSCWWPEMTTNLVKGPVDKILA